MVVTASQLRADIYKLLDLVLETGEAIEIDRKGQRLRIVADSPITVGRISRAKGIPDLIVGDPNDLIHIDHLVEWRDEWGL